MRGDVKDLEVLDRRLWREAEAALPYDEKLRPCSHWGGEGPCALCGPSESATGARVAALWPEVETVPPVAVPPALPVFRRKVANRRQAMAAACAAGTPPKEVAERFGVTRTAVYAAVKAMGAAK